MPCALERHPCSRKGGARGVREVPLRSCAMACHEEWQGRSGRCHPGSRSPLAPAAAAVHRGRRYAPRPRWPAVGRCPC
eukprot:11175902-Lingulodinium_polyedra.AAC.1